MKKKLNQSAAMVVVAGLIVLILLVRFHEKRSPVQPVAPMPTVVGVEGGVRFPGVYLLEKKEVSVAEAIDAAGGRNRRKAAGIAVPADLQKLGTGTMVLVTPGSSFPDVRIAPMSASARLTLGLKLDLNRATVEELCLVPQMKPEFAAAIVERRKQKIWSGLGELEVIVGVGPRTTEKWADYLRACRDICRD